MDVEIITKLTERRAKYAQAVDDFLNNRGLTMDDLAKDKLTLEQTYELAQKLHVPLEVLLGKITSGAKEYCLATEPLELCWLEDEGVFAAQYNNFCSKQRDLGWPYNVVVAVFVSDTGIESFPEQKQLEKGILKALSLIGDSPKKNYKTIFLEYFKKEKTLEEIGKELHVSPGHIRSNLAKIIRLLRNPARNCYIRYGIKDARRMQHSKMLKQRIENDQELLKDLEKSVAESNKKITSFLKKSKKSIHELELSTRAVTVLRMSGCKNLLDVVEKYTPYEFATSRGAGYKTYKEIMEKIEEETHYWSRVAAELSVEEREQMILGLDSGYEETMRKLLQL